MRYYLNKYSKIKESDYEKVQFEIGRNCNGMRCFPF